MNHRFLVPLVWVCVSLVFVSLIGAVLYINRETNIRRNDQIAACERGNTIRQTINTLVIHEGLAHDLAPLPVVDCAAITR